MPERGRRIQSLAPQRTRARAAILAAIALVVALTAALFVATTGYLEVATTSGAQELVTAAPADAASVVIETHVADDSDAQSAAAAEFFSEWFSETPITVDRTLRAGPVNSGAGGDQPEVLAVSDPALPAHADLVAGEWPDLRAGSGSAVVPAALQADAAESLGLAVGDTIAVGAAGQQLTLVVAATWRATDVVDPRFAGDPAVASGASDNAVGPFVIAEPALVELPSSHYVRWTVSPRIPELDAARIGPLGSSAEATNLAEGITRFGGITDESTTVSGRLATTAERVTAVASASAAVSSIPLALTGAIAIITLLQLSSLLAGSRQSETYMFRARGASVPQLTRWSTLEGIVIVVPAALVGAVGGYCAAAFFSSTDAAAPTLAQLMSVAAIVVTAVLVFAVRGFLAARAGERATPRSRSGILSVVLIVLVTLAAAISTWQLLLYGAGTVSPLAALAPTLVVAAVALLLGTMLSPVAGWLARAGAALPSLVPGLAARQVARQAAVFAVASLVVALATGGVTVATAIASQITTADAEASTLETGGDVRVRLDLQGQVSDGTEAVTAESYTALPGSTAAATVLAEPATIGADSVDVVGIARESLEPVVSTSDSIVDVPALVTAFGAGTAPVVLPDDAESITVTIASPAANPDRAGGIGVQAWLADATGALAKLDLGSVEFGDPALADGAPVTGDLPAGVGSWALLAVDTALVGAPSATEIEVTFPRVAAGDSELEPGLAATTVSSQRTSDRAIVFSATDAGLGGTPMGVVVTERLASHAGLAAGEAFDIAFATGRALSATVIGVTPVIPGSTAEFGVLVDLTDLDTAMLADRGPVLQAAEVWIASADAAATVEAASRASHYPASVQSRATASVAPLLAPTVRALILDLAGVVIIALIAFGATAATLFRSRREEGVVLSALGLSARGQATLRGIELATVTIFAALTGIVAGVVAATFSAGTLAASAVPGAAGGLPIPPLASAVLPLVAVVVALLAIDGGYAGAVGRSLALRRPVRAASSPPGGDRP